MTRPAGLDSREPPDHINPEGSEFYSVAMHALAAARVPHMVGGAYAFARYTRIVRHTKDFDIFLERRDCRRALDVLATLGYQTELTFSHWLGKARDGAHFVDLIFGAGNGVAIVDRDWFDHAPEDRLFGVPVLLIPAEEMIWSKAFIMERERFDGADVAHLIRARGAALDWPRLLARFANHWRVLYAHLVLFGAIYPDLRHLIPHTLMEDLSTRLRQEDADGAGARVCNGTLLSRAQYLVDLEQGCEDARLIPRGTMTREEIDRWTAAIGTIR